MTNPQTQSRTPYRTLATIVVVLLLVVSAGCAGLNGNEADDNDGLNDDEPVGDEDSTDESEADADVDADADSDDAGNGTEDTSNTDTDSTDDSDTDTDSEADESDADGVARTKLPADRKRLTTTQRMPTTRPRTMTARTSRPTTSRLTGAIAPTNPLMATVVNRPTVMGMSQPTVTATAPIMGTNPRTTSATVTKRTAMVRQQRQR